MKMKNGNVKFSSKNPTMETKAKAPSKPKTKKMTKSAMYKKG